MKQIFSGLAAAGCGLCLAVQLVNASTFTVINTNDSGAGSLRQAIIDANAHPNDPGAPPDVITFAIPGSGVQTIAPLSQLPDISDPVMIDATTQGQSSTPLVELTGSNISGPVTGLDVTGGGTTIKGLAITHWTVFAILLDTGGGNTIVGNFIGTDPSGTVAAGNGSAVSAINGSSNNLIGGATEGAGNLISGQTSEAVFAAGTGSSVVVKGNRFGTDLTGTKAIPNTNRAIHLVSSNCIIGGTGTGEGNLIAASGAQAIHLTGAATNTLIQGNRIGTDANGNAALANNVGIQVETSNNQIGGTDSGAGNLVSGSTLHGVYVIGSAATGNLIQGNFIGTNAAGAAAVGNGGAGVRLEGASNNVIGGTASGARNIISGNGGNGIFVAASATANLIQGNFIGTDVSGFSAIGNGAGIRIDSGTNQIGGTDAGAGNVISGNAGGYGIELSGKSTKTVVQANLIGTDANGAAAIANTDGIDILTGDNQIGGTTASVRNVISGNSDFGIFITAPAAGNLIQGNYVGTNITGSAKIPNDSGIVVQTANNNEIGGNAAGAGNIVSGNNSWGVVLLGGIDPATVPIGNHVAGNLIGLSAANDGALGNGRDGIICASAGPTLVGADVAGQGGANVVAYNGSTGIRITENAGGGATFPDSRGIWVDQNSIYANGAMGIAIGPNDGPVGIPNDPLDADSGSNGLQNYPVLTSAVTSGETLTISGKLSSEANHSYQVQFFASAVSDPSGHGEGQTFLGSQDVTTDGNGDATFTTTVTAPPGQPIISATATRLPDANDPNHYTSEFGPSIQVAGTRDKLQNISTRLRVLTGDDVLIAGLIITGDASAPKQVLLRAVGPSLTINGAPVPGSLQDPTLSLRDGNGNEIEFNDNWGDAPEPERTRIANSGITPSDPREPAIDRTLVTGFYTAIVRGKDDTTGIAVVEAYDRGVQAAANSAVASQDLALSSRLVNISTRGSCDSGDNVMIGGTIVGNGLGGGAHVVIRGIGPSLNVNGTPVPGRMLDPTLELHDANGITTVANDNWRSTQEQEITATGLQPSNDAEAAILTILPPGPSTVILRGSGDSSGIAVVELYELPETIAPGN